MSPSPRHMLDGVAHPTHRLICPQVAAAAKKQEAAKRAEAKRAEAAKANAKPDKVLARAQRIFSRRLRAESLRRSPRHRRDIRSAWWFGLSPLELARPRCRGEGVWEELSSASDSPFYLLTGRRRQGCYPEKRGFCQGLGREEGGRSASKVTSARWRGDSSHRRYIDPVTAEARWCGGSRKSTRVRERIENLSNNDFPQAAAERAAKQKKEVAAKAASEKKVGDPRGK